MKLSDSVLFLDIDGVLNDQNYRGPGTCGCMELDPERIRILSEIVSLKPVSVVLSSTWKNLAPSSGFPQDSETVHMWESLNQALNEAGFVICGCTPTVGSRPKEIYTWLSRHPETHHVLILDDDWGKESYAEYGLDDYLLETEFFVQENESGGLKEEHIPTAQKILELDYNKRKK